MCCKKRRHTKNSYVESIVKSIKWGHNYLAPDIQIDINTRENTKE